MVRHGGSSADSYPTFPIPSPCASIVATSTLRVKAFLPFSPRWISVLNNAKEAVFMKEVGDNRNKDDQPMNENVRELTHTIIQEVRRLPGNEICCDCGAPGKARNMGNSLIVKSGEARQKVLAGISQGDVLERLHCHTGCKKTTGELDMLHDCGFNSSEIHVHEMLVILLCLL